MYKAASLRKMGTNPSGSIQLIYTLWVDEFGSKVKVCEYERTFPLGYDNIAIADLFEEMVNKARDNIKTLSEGYGFKEVFTIE